MLTSNQINQIRTNKEILDELVRGYIAINMDDNTFGTALIMYYPTLTSKDVDELLITIKHRVKHINKPINQ